MLTLYNTLTRKKEAFTPLDETNIRMYVCGPTVYARPHIGNARSVVVYDVLYRLLKHLYEPQGAKVTYVRNITDVDDKINAAAKENGETIQALTERVTGWFHDDMDALNCLRPTHEPRATEYIGKMIAMIEKLIANGNAYVAEGHVLFDVTSDDDYGALSGRTVEEQQAGARVAVESYKRHPGDFVLWKPADAEDDESSKFPSPWGVGRPGWHIECSAMSTDLLGKDFDIHGGGADLKFPHHENEIAQSCCANPGSEFAKTWVHNGFLTVNGEKMSKSLGNFITVRDLLDNFLHPIHGEEIRWALLSTHYSKPLDWTETLLEQSKKELSDFIFAIYYASADIDHPEWEKYDNYYHSDPLACELWTLTPDHQQLVKDFFAFICDDLNIPAAKSKMFAALKDVNKNNEPQRCFSAKSALRNMTGFLGIDSENYIQRMIQTRSVVSKEDKQEIDSQITARAAAKAAKNWAEADRIRDKLKAQGIILEDRPDGTTDWRRA